MKKEAAFVLLISVTILQSCLKKIDSPCPNVTGLIPGAAAFGDTVIVTGTNFVSGSPGLYTVRVGNKTVQVADVPDAGTMRFVVPAGLGDGPLSVSVGGVNCQTPEPLHFIYQIKVKDIQLFVGTGFDNPSGMVVDGYGNLIVADRGNHVIRKVSALTRDVTLIAGKLNISGTNDNTDGTNAHFHSPYDVAVDIANNIYVADYSNHCIRKISASPSATVNTIAGVISKSGGNDGTVGNAKLSEPRAVAVNSSGNAVFIVEYNYSRLRYIANNTIKTLINGNPPINNALNLPIGIIYSEKRNPAFPILIADRSNHRILEVNINGKVNAAEIDLPFLPHDLEVDDSGNIIVLDKNGRLVAVVYRDNTVKYIAGVGINYDFQRPTGLAIDTKNKILYISDGPSNIIKATYQ